MRKASLLLTLAGVVAASTALAGTVVQGNFGRSPAYPTTPNGRFPQETAQIIEFKQRQVLQQQGATPDVAKNAAAGGILVSAAAFVGLGEENYQIAQRLGLVSAAATTAGAFLCYTGYGCAIGGPLIGLGMVAGLGSASICVVADCSISTSGSAQLTGDEVLTVTATDTPTNQSTYPFVNEVYYGNGVYNSHMTTYGVLREFVVKDSQSRYRRAFIMAYTAAGAGYPSYYQRSLVGDYVNTAYKGSPSPDVSRCENLSQATNGCSTAFRWRGAGSASADVCAPYLGCYLYYGSDTYSAPTSIVTKTYEPVQKLGYLDVGTGDALPPDAASKPVSNQFMAGTANSLWQRQGAAAPVPYSPAVAITEADVAAYRQAYPDRVSSLADLARPINAPGQPPRIGPIDDPIAPPQQVEVTNPAADPATQPGTPGEGDMELPDDPGLIGDPMAPARAFKDDFLGGWLNVTIDLPGGQCPFYEYNMSEMMGFEGGTTDNTQIFCDFPNQNSELIKYMFAILWTMLPGILIFKHS